MLATEQPNHFLDWPWYHWAALRPDATAIIDDEHKISWRQLCQDILLLQSAIKIEPGSSVAIKSDNNYLTLVTMLAAWLSGAKTLLLNRAILHHEKQKILAQADIKQIICPLDVLNQTQANLLGKPTVTSSTAFFFAGDNSFDANAPLTITLTSGSTGIPKAVVHCAQNHLASATGLFSYLPFNANDTWLLSLPLFHISGLAIVWRWLAKGAQLKISNCQGELLYQALQNVTHASLVPTQLQMLLKKPRPADLHSLLLGGAAIASSLSEQAQKHGFDCWCGYGMTEMASTICVKKTNGVDSVGSVLPFRQLSLSLQGEVLVQGQTLALGYLLSGKIIPFELKNGWFATKDLGRLLFNKKQKKELILGAKPVNIELQLLGRIDNMFICGGENVQPELVESVLSGYAGISQLYILPIDDEKWGQVPVALIDKPIDTNAFLSWAKAQLPAYQCPKKVFILPHELLKTSVKLSRAKLKAWLHLQTRSADIYYDH